MNELEQIIATRFGELVLALSRAEAEAAQLAKENAALKTKVEQLARKKPETR